jgi:branched-chain amino acid transport system permease protein
MFQPLNPLGRAVAFAAVAVLLVFPILVSDSYLLHLLILSMLFGTFAVSWNLVTGYAGLKTFGHHAFFGIAAYVSALISKHFGISPWLTMWLGAAVAALIGLLIALPVLRLRSIPHIAIVTLSFAEIVRVVISNLKEITRGEMGLWGIPVFDGFALPWFGVEVVFNAAEKVPYYYLMAALFLGTVYLTNRLIKSKIGLAIVAVRDAQDAAESLGIYLAYYKLLVFALSAFLVGLSGAFYAHYIVLLTPTAAVGIDLMIGVVAMVLVGGLGTQLGPIVGAFALTLGIESLRFLGEYRMLVYGGIIIVVVMFAPRGLAAPFDRLGPLLGFGRRADDAAPDPLRTRTPEKVHD